MANRQRDNRYAIFIKLINIIMKDKITLDEAIKIINDLGMWEIIDPYCQANPAPTVHFIWLAVDSNGNERMTTCKDGFQQFSPKLYHSSNSKNNEIRSKACKERKKVCSYIDIQMKDDHWVEIPLKKDIGKWGTYPQWSYLPKGKIKN
jgi:hypothetical protein